MATNSATETRVPLLAEQWVQMRELRQHKPGNPEHGALLSLWLPANITVLALKEELVAGLPPFTGHNHCRPMRLECRREEGGNLLTNYTRPWVQRWVQPWVQDQATGENQPQSPQKISSKLTA